MELTGAKGDRKNCSTPSKNITANVNSADQFQTITETCEKPKAVTCRSMRATIDHIRTVHRESTAIDSLDALRKEDLEPITSEYPRRDHITNNFQSALKDTLIYNLACNNNDKMMHYLLAPPTNFKKRPGSSNKTSKTCRDSVRISNSVSASPINMDLSNKFEMAPAKFRQFSRQTRSKQEAEKLLRPYLFDPTINHNRTYVVMPVGVIYDRKLETKPQNVAHLKECLMVSKTTHDLNSTQKNHHLKQTKVGNSKANTKWTASAAAKQVDPIKKSFAAPKYRKTPAEKLVSFVIKQNNIKTATNTFLAPKQHSNVTIPKQETPIIFPLTPLNAFKNKKLLEKDIQRVVQAIEEKIVNILSDPIKHNPEAFNNVEKEILDILDTMRRLKQGADEAEKSKTPLLDSIENDMRHSAESFKSIASTLELLKEDTTATEQQKIETEKEPNDFEPILLHDVDSKIMTTSEKNGSTELVAEKSKKNQLETTVSKTKGSDARLPIFFVFLRVSG